MNKSVTSGNILHITHPWGGGIPTYISDLGDILKEEYAFFVLKCADGKVIVEHGAQRFCYRLSRPLLIDDFSHKEYRQIIELIMIAFDIQIVHINSTLGHTFDIFEVPKKLGLKVIYTVHDFFYICPSFHMVYKDGKHCGGCKLGEEKKKCLKGHPYVNYPDFDEVLLNKWRHEFLRVKSNIDLFIFPSFSAEKIFLSYFDIPENNRRVIYHGTRFDNKEKLCASGMKGELRVGIIGSIFRHKGEDLLGFVLKNIHDDKIKFYHFGEGTLKGKNLLNYGRYDPANIVNLLREYEIEVSLLLSTWPETFSYTLSESLAAGIPPIVTNLGALKERIEQPNVGWIVDYNNPGQICVLLKFLKENKNDIKERCRRITHFHLKSIDEMKKDYGEVYNLLISTRRSARFEKAAIEGAAYQLDHMKYEPLSQQHDEQFPGRPLSRVRDFLEKCKAKLLNSSK